MGHIFHCFTGTGFSWLAVAGKRQSLEVCRIPVIQPGGATSGLYGGAGLLVPTAELRRIPQEEVWASSRSVAVRIEVTRYVQ
jgi:hypothetical protein